jgi:hypothetical protein
MTPKLTPEWDSRNFSEASLRGTQPLKTLFRISDPRNAAPENTTPWMAPLSRSGSIASSDDDFTATNLAG